MSPAIADLLQDFAPRPRPVKPAAVVSPATIVVAAPAEPAIDVDAIVAAAVGKAEADMRQRLEGLYETQAAEERERHEKELADVRNAVTVELGARVAEAMRDLERKAIDAATDVAARILSRLADDKVRTSAVEALAGSVRSALEDGQAIRVRVSGPQSLFLPFTAAMGDHARHLEFTESDSCDLTVAIDEALMETRLAEWSAALPGASR